MITRLYQKTTSLGKGWLREVAWKIMGNLSWADRVGHVGKVEIVAVREDGSEEVLVEKKNLVVDAGLNAIRDTLQDSSPNLYIEDFALGKDGTSPSASDTSLGNQVHREAFDGYTDTATGEARFNGLLDSIEPSSQPVDIAEFGVYLSDDTLYSRITFTAETKDSTQEWRIRYTSTWSNA